MSTVLSLLTLGSRLFGNPPTIKSRTSKDPLSSEFGGFFGWVDVYNQRNGGNRALAPFEAMVYQPASAFRAALTFTALACVLHTCSLSGTARLIHNLIFSEKSWAETFGESLASISVKPATDFGKGLIKGLGRATYDFFKELKDASVDQFTQNARSIWSSQDESSIQATLRHNKACMQSDVCANIISQLDHAPAFSSYLLPSLALVFTSLGLAGYLYYSNNASAETAEHLTPTEKIPEPHQPSSSTTT